MGFNGTATVRERTNPLADASCYSPVRQGGDSLLMNAFLDPFAGPFAVYQLVENG